MKHQLWAIPDKKTAKSQAIQIGKSNAKEYNEKGYGIFHTVNCFGERRRTEETTKLSSFYVDLDEGTKDQQMAMIKQCPTPSLVVESRNGFHVYWAIRNNMIKDHGFEDAIENYKLIQEMIVEVLNGDQKAKDVPRLLRTPNYYHHKGEPYLVKDILSTNRAYTCRDMFEIFKPHYQPKAKIKIEKPINFSTSTMASSDNFWNSVNKIPSDEALARFSGTKYVNKEVFSLRANSNGTRQIIVNGKATGSWIDEAGLIGNGGPTIANWLKYYLNDMGLVANAIKEVYPELCDSGIRIFGE